MKNILLITSSPRGEASHSTKVGRDLVAKFQSAYPEANVNVRDLWQVPPPMIDEAFTHAAFTPEEARNADQRNRLSLSDELIDEILTADTLVIASGMINFGVSTALKAWFDHIARAGKTFRYGGTGPEGLLKGRKAYLVTAYGGVYSTGPMQAMDFQAPYIRSTLAFLGVEVADTIIVEGVAFGEEATQTALELARQKVETLLA